MPWPTRKKASELPNDSVRIDQPRVTDDAVKNRMSANVESSTDSLPKAGSTNLSNGCKQCRKARRLSVTPTTRSEMFMPIRRFQLHSHRNNQSPKRGRARSVSFNHEKPQFGIGNCWV